MPSVWSIRIRALGVVAACACGCASFVGADQGGQSEPSADAGPSDALADGGPTEPGDATSDTSSSILVAEYGFEGNQPGCQPGWSNQIAIADPVTTAHSSSYACRICNDSPAPAFYGLHLSPLLMGDAGSYALQAWVHAAPDSGPPPNLQLRFEYTPDGGQPVGNSDNVLLTQEWRRGQSLLVVPGPGPVALGIAVLAQGNVGSCFIIDDITLHYAP